MLLAYSFALTIIDFSIVNVNLVDDTCNFHKYTYNKINFQYKNNFVNTSCKKTKSINGCMNTKAIRYNFFAKVEDGSFKYHYYESENFPTRI